MRPLLVAKWIIEKKAAPPMLFEEFMEEELDNEIKPAVTRLLELKKTLPEIGMATKFDYPESYAGQKYLPRFLGLKMHIE